MTPRLLMERFGQDSDFFLRCRVVGCSRADFVRRANLGVAAPDMDFVVTAKPMVLLDRFRQQGRLGGGPTRWTCVKDRKLRSASSRTGSSSAGLKFRRSAFRSDERKVSLLAPPLLGLVDDSRAIVVSVNTATPLPQCHVYHRMRTSGTKRQGSYPSRAALRKCSCHTARGHC